MPTYRHWGAHVVSYLCTYICSFVAVVAVAASAV